MYLPALSSSAVYKLYGTIPPNLDLGTSTGDISLTANKVDMTIEMDLGTRDDGNLEATAFNLNLDLDIPSSSSWKLDSAGNHHEVV